MLRRTLLPFAFLVAACLASAQTVRHEKYKLPNGMIVILSPDRTLPLASVNIYYRVGAKDEVKGRSGFAHLFEHLMFMGTERVPGGEFDKIMEGAGGSNNASTWEDKTTYFETGPSNLLPTLLWLEADRLEALGRTMTQEKLDLQREVVRNERRESENTPYGNAYEALPRLMFPPGHPYAHSVIGSHEDLQAATVADVTGFFSTFYVPNNASLVVAGDFEPREIKPLIARLFGTLPRRPAPPRPRAQAPRFTGVRRETMEDAVTYPKTIMAWHSPAFYKPGDAEMDLVAASLSDGINSRLYQRLVVRDKLASDVSAQQYSMQLGSQFLIDATAAEGASLDRLEAAIDEELERFRREGPTREELRRHVAKREFGVLNGLQSVEAKADQLNNYEFYLGKPDSFRWDLDRYRRATPQGVRDAARRVLKPGERLILRVVPKKEEGEKPGAEARVDRFTQRRENPRDVRPAIPAPREFQPPTPRELTLSNGLRVFYWQRPNLPLMSVTLALKGGATLDPAEKAGRATLVAEMLDEGTGELDARAFEAAIEGLGARFGAGASREGTTASMSVLSANFDRALDLTASAILRPRFDATEWERVQRLTIAALEQQSDDPMEVARKVGLREFFGAAHPYGRPVEGTPETVRVLTPEDLRGAHRAVFVPERAALFVAGSLPESQVRASLERTFGTWRGSGGSAERPTYPAPANQGLRVVIVDRPEAVQTVVRFVMPAPAYGDPSRVRLLSLGTILGGSFTSRLNANLREAKGYAYGASSSYAMDPAVGYLIAGAPVRTDVTGASVREFLAEFRKIRAGDVTEAEASKAATLRRTSAVESIASLEGLLGTAAGLFLQDRPFSAFAEDLRALGAVRASDLNALANTAIPLERGVLVLVGDKDEILKQLQGLELPTPVEVKG